MNAINTNEFTYTDDHITAIRDYPHILGHIAGKDKLNILHSRWIRYLWDGLHLKDSDENVRAIMAHRGSYKTTAMAIGIVRWMLFHPDDRIGLIRKTFTDAAEVVETVAAIMDMDEVRALFKHAHGHFPKARVRRFGKLRYNFKNTVSPEGNVNAHGLDASIVGTHYDIIWMDDFITLRDRVSPSERNKTKELVREIITNIIDPGCPVLCTGTPWHRDDAWNVLSCDIPKFNVADCGILTEKEIRQKKKNTTPFLYSINYDLKIVTDEGALFQDPNQIRHWDYLSKGAYAHLDAGYDGDNCCALTIMSKRASNNDRFQAGGWVYPGNVKDWIPFVVKMYKKYRVRKIFIENNADKGYTADKLREYNLSVGQYDERMNKHIKISTVLYDVWEDIDWIKDTEDEYLNQIIDYRKNQEPDDAPDSASSLLREAFEGTVQNALALYQW